MRPPAQDSQAPKARHFLEGSYGFWELAGAGESPIPGR